jgi:hypothetical protein
MNKTLLKIQFFFSSPGFFALTFSKLETNYMFLIVTRLLFAAACILPLSRAPSLAGKRTGIEGYIFRVSGNRMPSPGNPLPPPKGFRTTLYVYELTSLDQVSRVNESPFYKELRSRLIRTVQSDDSGYFFVSLPPGQYSLFTKKEELYYANMFDGQNHISPVTVAGGKVAQINVNVDYDAAY